MSEQNPWLSWLGAAHVCLYDHLKLTSWKKKQDRPKYLLKRGGFDAVAPEHASVRLLMESTDGDIFSMIDMLWTRWVHTLGGGPTSSYITLHFPTSPFILLHHPSFSYIILYQPRSPPFDFLDTLGRSIGHTCTVGRTFRYMKVCVYEAMFTVVLMRSYKKKTSLNLQTTSFWSA